MRQPCAAVGPEGPATLLPGDAAAFYAAALQVVAQQAAAQGSPLPSDLVQYLSGLSPTTADIGTVFQDLATGAAGALSALQLDRVDPIREETSTRVVFGEKGLIGGRFMATGDLWHSRRE